MLKKYKAMSLLASRIDPLYLEKIYGIKLSYTSSFSYYNKTSTFDQSSSPSSLFSSFPPSFSAHMFNDTSSSSSFSTSSSSSSSFLNNTTSSYSSLQHYEHGIELTECYATLRSYMTPFGLPDVARAARIILKDYVMV
jgi:hypothetical protein